MSAPLVSILVPTYNRRAFIGPCLESALAQTYQDFEVVICDNVSDDGTWELCQEFASRDSRIKLFRNQANIGPVANWVRCQKEARGVLGKYLFSDDLLFPACLEKMVPFLSRSDVAFAFSVIEIGTTPEAAVPNWIWRKRTQRVSSSKFIRDMVRHWNLPGSPCAALFRMTDLRENLMGVLPTGEDLSSHGGGPDLLLFLLAARKYPYVAFIREPMVFFRLHPGSITVDGMGGRVMEGYRRASLWYSQKYLSLSETEEIIAHIWMMELKKSRKWVSPKAALAVFKLSINPMRALRAVPGEMIRYTPTLVRKTLRRVERLIMRR